MKKYLNYPISKIDHNLRRVFNQANPYEYKTGKGWYIEANLYLQQIADHFNLPLKKVTAICAVLSPANPWNSNIKDTYNLIRFKGKITSVTYPQNILKANKILKSKQDNYLQYVSGPKVSSFFDNLYYTIKSDCVTIDTHIFRCALNDSNLNINGSLPITYIKEIDRVIRAIAIEHDLRPLQAQAIIWTVWKRLTFSRNTNFDQKFFMF